MTADLLAGRDNESNVWVENLKTGDSVYKSERTGDRYQMAPSGVVGSVISVPVKVAKEAFFRRAVSRGALRLLNDQEALDREEELILLDEAEATADRTLEALEKGASESGSRYKKKGLTDDGSEGKSVTAKQVWKEKSTKAPSTVRRAEITAPAIPLDEVPDGPLPAIIEAPVKEGDPNWKSDTGE